MGPPPRQPYADQKARRATPLRHGPGAEQVAGRLAREARSSPRTIYRFIYAQMKNRVFLAPGPKPNAGAVRWGAARRDSAARWRKGRAGMADLMLFRIYKPS